MLLLQSLPGDILLEIASHIPLPSEVLHLSLTASGFIFEDLIPALYSEVILNGPVQCIQTLNMLGSYPQRARHVRSLCVKPDDNSAGIPTQPVWGRGALYNGYAISAAVRRAAFGMEVLQRFMWDGEELPPYDDMWFALRRFCPQLKYVGTALGSILTSPNSHLFDFSNLRGFSLIFKEGFYLNFEGVTRDEAIPGYQRLWEMLIKRCPHLEELVIDSLSPTEPVDAHRLTRGRWPKLRTLILGDVVTDWHTTLNSAAKRSFVTFLDAHPSIKALHLRGRQPSVSAPTILEALQPSSLCKVDDFGGSLDQLQSFRHRAHLRSLCIPDPVILRESTPLAMSGVLSSVPSLVSLSISFTLLHGYDNGSIIRSIASACPMLEHLDFTCTVDTTPLEFCSKPTSQETFCRAIKPLGRLKSLHLRIVKARGEESLAACGSQLVFTNPRLANFKISFLSRESTINERSNPPVVLQSAAFELTADKHGLPVSLRIVEHHQPLLRWRTAPRRVQVVGLRPVGYPGTHSGSVLSLVLSPTPAGQEMRMLCFCVALLTSAVVGAVML
ncbi:hypothetical protein K488DRAFT_50296 [Vararia minispora EC-137]|uniref:Uncharacterized protein n=1 Tax=Vararia minispora EC-137 TaxID=1314806 RepID=A0ACB8QKS1_9AGAM|nr:hypothetical protein K488DRAFT_50296 [Vararia minispora EC-137]